LSGGAAAPEIEEVKATAGGAVRTLSRSWATSRWRVRMESQSNHRMKMHEEDKVVCDHMFPLSRDRSQEDFFYPSMAQEIIDVNDLNYEYYTPARILCLKSSVLPLICGVR
jgi:hypothetical protein